MPRSLSIPTLGTAALMLVLLTVMCCFFLVNPSHGDASCVPQQTDGFSWTATDGDGGEKPPASESSYSDYNPPCSENQSLPAYRPTVSLLVHFEPFKALPQVYPDRFVPPQNLQEYCQIA